MQIIGQTAWWALRVFGGGGAEGVARAGLPVGLVRAPALPESIDAALFETHWLYWIIALAVGLALLYRGRTLTNRGMMTAGGVIAAAAVVWAGMALLVDTPGERLYAAHQGMAAAAADGNIDKLMGYLADDFTCPQLGIEDVKKSRGQLEEALKEYDVKGSKITAYHTDRSGDQAQVRVTLITETNMGPIQTTWQLVWGDVPGEDWKIREAELQAVGDQPVTSDFHITGGRGGGLGL